MLLDSGLAAGDTEHITVGIPNYAPLAFKDEQGRITGLYIELLEKIANEKGWQLEYVVKSWPELMSLLQKGQLDLMTCIAKNDERTTRFEFSKEIISLSWGQVFRSQDSKITTILDLDGRQVAVVASDINYLNLKNSCRQFGVTCQFAEKSSYEEAANAVANGEVEALAMASVISRSYVSKHHLVPTAIMYNPSHSYWAAPKGMSLGLLAAIDQTLERWKKEVGSPFYQAQERWLYAPADTSLITAHQVLYSGVAIAFAISLLMLWLVTLKQQVTARTGELQQSLNRYQELFENASMGIFLADQQPKIFDANPRASQITGFSRQELCSFHARDIIHPDSMQEITLEEVTDRALAKGSAVYERLYRTKSGHPVPVEVNLFVSPETGYHTVMFQDVTVKRRAEEQLRENQTFLANVFACIRDGISVIDTNMNIIHVNPTMEQWYSYQSSPLGQKCYTVYRGTDVPCDPCPSLRAMYSGKAESEVLPGPPGSQIEWLEMHSYPFRTEDAGQVKGVIEFIRDITERKKAEEALSKSEYKHRIIFENSPLGMVLLDNRGVIMDCNERFIELMGSSREKVIGFNTAEKSNPKMQEATKRAIAGEVAVYEDLYTSVTGGKTLYIRAVFSPVNPGQAPTEVIATIEDVSKRKMAEEALCESEAKFRAMFEKSPVGIMTFNEDGIITQCNSKLAEILGVQGGSVMIGFDMLKKLQNTEVRQSVIDAIHRDEGFYQGPYTSVIAGKSTFVKMHHRKIVPGVWLSVIEDQTDIKTVEQKLKHSKERLEDTVRERTGELSATVDELKRRNVESETLARLGDLLQACETESESYQIILSLCQQIFPDHSGFLGIFDESTDSIRIEGVFGAYAPDAEEFEKHDCWALRRGGSHFVTSADIAPLCPHAKLPDKGTSLCIPIGAKGEFLGLLHLCCELYEGIPDSCEPQMRLISDLAKRVTELYALSLSNIRLRIRLRHQSIRDALTGLFNRRHMDAALYREIRRAERKKLSVGVLLFDVDHFKQFNDQYGHDAGDAVLSSLGELLRKMTRGEDIACRYGGEELLVILPDCNSADARRRAEDFRSAIERLKITHKGKGLQVTSSIGVASYPDHGVQTDTLISAADSALYRAKKAGRNCVVVA